MKMIIELIKISLPQTYDTFPKKFDSDLFKDQ